jgi:hypothetical protein
MNDELINKINNFIKDKTFESEYTPTFNTNPVKMQYQFKIDKIGQLISIGEWTDFIFTSVKIVNGEGIMNLYLASYKNKEIVGRTKVSDMWYRLSVDISRDIEQFLKFFGVDMEVLVDNLKFEPNEDFVSLADLDKFK